MIRKLWKLFSPSQVEKVDSLALSKKMLLVRQTVKTGCYPVSAIQKSRTLKNWKLIQYEKGTSVKAPPGLWQFGRSSNSSRTSLGVAKKEIVT